MLTYGTREQLFFGAHKPFAALLDISCLTPLVYTLTAKAYKLDYRTACVFVPYCAWLTYATYLNGETSRKARACDNSSSESHPLMHARTFPLTSNDRSRLLVAQRRQGQGGAEEEGPLRRFGAALEDSRLFGTALEFSVLHAFANHLAVTRACTCVAHAGPCTCWRRCEKGNTSGRLFRAAKA